MDFTTITGLIGSLGFPIIMCIMLFNWIQKMNEQHKEEMTKVTEALNNNTLALTVLATKIDSINMAKEDKTNDKTNNS